MGTGLPIALSSLALGKAFDLIDNSILITKILNLNLSVRITNWIKRKQRVKLATDCKSE